MSYAIDAAIEWCEAGHREECAEMPLGGGWTKGTSCICGREHMDAVLSEYNKLRADLAQAKAAMVQVREALEAIRALKLETSWPHDLAGEALAAMNKVLP